MQCSLISKLPVSKKNTRICYVRQIQDKLKYLGRNPEPLERFCHVKEKFFIKRITTQKLFYVVVDTSLVVAVIVAVVVVVVIVAVVVVVVYSSSVTYLLKNSKKIFD